MIDIISEIVRHSPNSPKELVVLKMKYYVDETKTDYEIHFCNGKAFQQNGGFHWKTADWYNNGDSFDKYGASFVCEGHEEFYTPHQLVDLVSSGVATIPKLQCNEIL